MKQFSRRIAWNTFFLTSNVMRKMFNIFSLQILMKTNFCKLLCFFVCLYLFIIIVLLINIINFIPNRHSFLKMHEEGVAEQLRNSFIPPMPKVCEELDLFEPATVIDVFTAFKMVLVSYITAVGLGKILYHEFINLMIFMLLLSFFYFGCH